MLYEQDIFFLLNLKRKQSSIVSTLLCLLLSQDDDVLIEIAILKPFFFRSGVNFWSIFDRNRLQQLSTLTIVIQMAHSNIAVNSASPFPRLYYWVLWWVTLFFLVKAVGCDICLRQCRMSHSLIYFCVVTFFVSFAKYIVLCNMALLQQQCSYIPWCCHVSVFWGKKRVLSFLHVGAEGVGPVSTLGQCTIWTVQLCIWLYVLWICVPRKGISESDCCEAKIFRSCT